MSEITQQLLNSGAKQHLVSSMLSSVSLLSLQFKQEVEGEKSADVTETGPSFMKVEHKKPLL